MPLRIDYVARETFTNLRRNLLMTTAAVMTVAVSLFLVGGALLLRRGVDNATLQFRNGIEASIFLKPTATPAQTQAVGRELANMPEVKRVQYVSQKEAYEEFKRLFRNDPDLVESVTADVLPPSFRVVPKVAEQIELIGNRFERRDGVLQVEYAKDQIKNLLSVTRYLQLGIIIVAGVLLFSASLLILNTIRMAIFARRREVGVMKLVGATNWFIRVPFMFEGLLQGVAGAAAAFVFVFIGKNLAQESISQVELFRQFSVTTGEVMGTGIFMIVVGAVVGAVGSAVAVSRFLDV